MKKINKNSDNDKGVALFITIAVITLLIAFTIEMNRTARSTIDSAVITRDRSFLSHMAYSGINIGMAVLVSDKRKDEEEKKKVDSIHEDWADEEVIADLLSEIPFEDGEITLKITDELGKIQVNALVDYPEGKGFDEKQKELLDRFVRPIVSVDESADLNATTDIINCFKDWLDDDDDIITGLNGAESDYYEDLEPPYSCRNGPFTHLGELTLVKGFTPELVSMLVEAAALYEALTESEESIFEDEEESVNDDKAKEPKIADFFTVHGMKKTSKKSDGKSFTYDGKININTAPLHVIRSLLTDEYEDLAEEIYDFREIDPDEEDTTGGIVADLSKSTWYKDAPGCSDVKIDSALIMTTSDIFRIESTAKLNDIKLTVSAVVQREKDSESDKWKCRMLSREIK